MQHAISKVIQVPSVYEKKSTGKSPRHKTLTILSNIICRNEIEIQMDQLIPAKRSCLLFLNQKKEFVF